MYDYAIIIHPTNEELLHKYEPGMKNRPRALVKKVLEWMSPFKAAEVEGLNSYLGRTAKGTLVMCPLLMEQMVTLSPTKIMKAVLEATHFAKALHPKIIGLTAYAAFSGNKGQDLADIIRLPLTTGTTYTLGMMPEAILRAVSRMQMDLKRANVLILGVTSGVGRYAAEIFSQFVPYVYVTAHNQEKFLLFLSALSKEKRAKIIYAKDLEAILPKSNIVVVATNRIPPDFNLQRLNPGAIIFDSSYPRRISPEVRDDILVIDGVSIRPPGQTVFNFDFGLPLGLCYPCMAEPMILALERKFEHYSLGREIDPYKIREILRLGAKHGFEIAGLTRAERAISEEDILKVKNNSQKKRRR